MKLHRWAALGTLLLVAGAFSTMIGGTSQTISVSTQPADASCEFLRRGLVVGLIDSTPGSVEVQKSRRKITITCKKDGYQDGVYRNESAFVSATLTTFLLGGIIGVGVDTATGAGNHYRTDIAIVLEPLSPALPAARKPGKRPEHPPVAGTQVTAAPSS